MQKHLKEKLWILFFRCVFNNTDSEKKGHIIKVVH